MPKLIRDKALVNDNWTLIKEARDSSILAALPPGINLIVPLKMWKNYREELDNHAGRVGIWLDSDQFVGDIAADTSEEIMQLPLIALNFPLFSDGRSYTNARELRQRGYQGEIRAIGDVLRDQLFYMSRCGFTAFSLRHDQDPDACLDAFNDFHTGYQASIDQPLPLYRRR
ncbi:MAG: DUF934 domain-containing protein [Pseudohongiellaceae bacterium]